MKLNSIFFDKDKISIILMGDEHIGSKYHDSDLHKQWIDWILNEKDSYVIGMGDNIECATRDSIGAGIFEQSDIVQEQMEEYIKRIKPLADEGKLIGLLRGNHEERIFKHSGFDITKTISKILKVKDFNVGVAHYFKVGNQNYTLYTTHGHSGARLPHTKIKTCIDLSNMIDVEIYGMGHLHQLSHHVRQFYYIDKRGKQVKESTKHFILTGSYLTHWGSYAMKSGYEMMRKGSPRIKLHGNQKLIKVTL